MLIEPAAPASIAASAEQLGGTNDVSEQHRLDHSFVDGGRRRTADEIEDGRTHRVIQKRHPRPDFKNRILAAFNEGMQHRPDTTFGTMNADVLAHFDPTFERQDFVDLIVNNSWPE